METEQTATLPPLSYAFARLHGIIVADGEGGVPVLAHRPGAAREALLEARRVFGAPIRPEQMSADEFTRLISKTYAQSDLSRSADAAIGIYRSSPRACRKHLTFWTTLMMRPLSV